MSNKSLKIPKGQSETAYRRTDNTMVKRKSLTAFIFQCPLILTCTSLGEG